MVTVAGVSTRGWVYFGDCGAVTRWPSTWTASRLVAWTTGPGRERWRGDQRQAEREGQGAGERRDDGNGAGHGCVPGS